MASTAAHSPDWLDEAVSAFGSACMSKLAGPGDPEAAIRAPLESLLAAVGTSLRVKATFHDEVRDPERQVRPDYAVSVGGAITGYVEVKAPHKIIDPARFHGHDLKQWERQRDLPNLIYTNGTQWRLYRDGEPVGEPVNFAGGSLKDAGSSLSAPPGFEALITDFLRWHPAPITSVAALVRAVAPLTRLLRGEVLDQLDAERRAIAAGSREVDQPFHGLARDWRALLFPQADDRTFADGYAQTVTFALLLARSEGVDVAGRPLHQIGKALGSGHSLMGKALQLLTDDVAADFQVALDLLVRIVGAVDWPKVRKGKRDTYLHLYEHFLELYDNDLRKASGSYYTPREVVEPMVRLAEEALVTRLGKARGFRDESVLTVDPAMGTGTYLHTILESAAEATEIHDGPGAVPGAITKVAERLIGFEIQMGPYAVAELRASDLLRDKHAEAPPGGMRLYVTDTLDDPYASLAQLGSGLNLIAQSRHKANKAKLKANVTVVIGNPPYKQLAIGDGGWVEDGSTAHGADARAILDDFLVDVPGRFRAKLKNLYVYFWRWATWKTWESTGTSADDGDAGIVCFISTSGYVTGRAFTAMREYLRRHASEGWIIDLTPEGQTPDVSTRIFPGVRQPLAIGLFVRHPDATTDVPATVHYRAVQGRQADKFATLASIHLDDDGWRDARNGWAAPLTAAADGAWDTYPAVSDLLPWYSPGVFPTRTWVYAPAPAILHARWRSLISEPDPRTRSALFKEGRDANLTKTKEPLPGLDTYRGTSIPFERENGACPRPVRVGYRSFDRQWALPDSRLMDMPRRDLWAARIPNQVFVIEQHAHPFSDGPGLVFTALIPDFDHFNGRGGRALPFLHPDGSPNLAPGLLAAMSRALGCDVSANDVIAYLAGVVANPAFVTTFADELTTPGVRVPITTDADLFADVVAVGEEIVWLHTYGEAFTSPERPQGDVRYPQGDGRQPLNLTQITAIPDEVAYDDDRSVLILGTGEFGPVPRAVWEYAVSGKSVIRSWVNYRKREPGGRKSSPLNQVHAATWEADWTSEFIDLLTVLTRLVALEPLQADLTARVLAGPVLTMSALREGGVRWPVKPFDRVPHYGLARTQSEEVDRPGQATLDWL